MIYLLRCPNCKNKMKYSPMKSGDSKRKACVYCGKSFTVKNNVLKKS